MIHHEEFEVARQLLPIFPMLIGVLVYFGRALRRSLRKDK